MAVSPTDEFVSNLGEDCIGGAAHLKNRDTPPQRLGCRASYAPRTKHFLVLPMGARQFLLGGALRRLTNSILSLTKFFRYHDARVFI